MDEIDIGTKAERVSAIPQSRPTDAISFCGSVVPLAVLETISTFSMSAILVLGSPLTTSMSAGLQRSDAESFSQEVRAIFRLNVNRLQR